MSSRLSTGLGAAVLLAVLLGAGPAFAEDITGTPDNEVLLGTPQRDTIHGLAGDDDIRPGEGNDRAFGDEGTDYFDWVDGDGRDRIDGGPDGNSSGDHLAISASGKFRLHIDALGAGPLITAKKGLEAIAVNRIEEIRITGNGGLGTVEVSSDKGILPPDLPGRVPCPHDIGCIQSDDLYISDWLRVDARKVQASTLIVGHSDAGGPHVVRGSEKFFDAIGCIDGGCWPGDDEIWTGDGGSYLSPCDGSNIIHLGHGIDMVDTDVADCNNTVYAFEQEDLLGFVDRAANVSDIDTNNDGWVDVKDKAVKLRNGSMTITFPFPFDQSRRPSVTLIGVKRISLDHIIATCSDDEGCLE